MLQTMEKVYQPGERVIVKSKGWTFYGTVIRAQCVQGSWYVEFNSDQYGYIYWKESVDGGSIRPE